MLLYGETDSAKNAVHLIFSGEIASPTQTAPNPSIAPERNVRGMDAAGLITPVVEAELPPELLTRLQRVRETE